MYAPKPLRYKAIKDVPKDATDIICTMEFFCFKFYVWYHKRMPPGFSSFDIRVLDLEFCDESIKVNFEVVATFIEHPCFNPT